MPAPAPVLREDRSGCSLLPAWDPRRILRDSSPRLERRARMNLRDCSPRLRASRLSEGVVYVALLSPLFFHSAHIVGVAVLAGCSATTADGRYAARPPLRLRLCAPLRPLRLPR